MNALIIEKAIAKVCGLKLCQMALTDIWGHTVDGKTWENFPSYTSDLNAMNEAEKVLTTLQQGEYTWELTGVVASHDPDSMEGDWLTHTATAAERSEAFLRVLSLWTD